MSLVEEPRDDVADSGSGVVHEYDGILEQDNRLPRWWLATLFGTILFGFGYWIHYHTYGTGKLPSTVYAEHQAAEIAKEAERMKQAGEVTPEMMATLQKDSGTVAQGKELFDATCVTCHDAGGKGKIGPNLTDPYWIHGGDSLAVYKTIRDGFLPKQMPAWGKTLGEAKVRAVTAYVLTIRNTNAPGGKDPQGDKVGN